jgi:heavy metal sensor kinase
LTVWTTAAFTAMLALLGTGAVVLLDRGLRENIDDSLLSAARTIAASTRAPAGPRDLGEAIESMLGPALAERFFRLLDPLGRPDPRLAPRARERVYLTPRALQNAERGEATFETLPVGEPPGTAPVRLLTLPVVQRGRLVNLVQVGMSLANAEAVRARFLLILLGLTPFAVGAAAAGGWLLARRALAPVDAMVEAAVEIEAEDLSRRIETPPADDEIGRLAAVLNQMLGRLERSFATVRDFSADAAHELRTPLTILKGELEVALRSSLEPAEVRRVLSSCLEEVERLGSLVEDLLFLARSDSDALNLGAAAVDLNEVLRDVAPALQALAAKAAVEFRIAPGPPLWVRGQTSLLFRLLLNLGENAIKYTPAGGRVSVGAHESGAEAVLEVRDTGPGISPEQQSRIFARFYRGDRARSGGGSGLGLALVQSIATLHGGRVSVESTVGRGSCFRVRLPLGAPGGPRSSPA